MLTRRPRSSCSATEVSKNTGAGYLWMGLNCVATAAYLLFMRGRIKMLGFKDLVRPLFLAPSSTLAPG